MVDGANLAQGGVSVHTGHHYVHKDKVDVRLLFQDRDGIGTTLGGFHLGVTTFEECSQGKDVAEVVVDDEDAATGKWVIVKGVGKPAVPPRCGVLRLCRVLVL